MNAQLPLAYRADGGSPRGLFQHRAPTERTRLVGGSPVVATSTDRNASSSLFGVDGRDAVDDGLGLGGGLFCEVDGAFWE